LGTPRKGRFVRGVNNSYEVNDAAAKKNLLDVMAADGRLYGIGDQCVLA
jgi:hypothetical protein